MPIRTIQISTTTRDGKTRVETSRQTRRPGWLGRIVLALLAFGLLAVSLLIAIPLLIVVVVVVAGLLAYWRLRLALARRREAGSGRRNVRVVRRAGRP